jgi:hypothetical protein
MKETASKYIIMKKKLLKRLLLLALFAGTSFLIIILAIYLYNPSLIYKIKDKTFDYYNWQIKNENVDGIEDFSQGYVKPIADWVPLSFGQALPNVITINGKPYHDLVQALSALKNGDELVIGAGTYRTPLVIVANDITIRGDGHVIFEEATAKGKGLILAKGNNLRVVNIECRNVNVRDGNGACVRLEGSGLELNHIYFHDSQQGVLSGKNSGSIFIDDSRFENLGKSGQAHGIYIGSGELYINNSKFLSSKDEGHEIKSRAKKTVIRNSLIASLSGRDSRLIDISQGGELVIEDNILQQGNKTSNSDLIGFLLEQNSHKINSIFIKNNVFLLDRIRGSQILHAGKNIESITFTGNMIIGKYFDKNIDSTNIVFESRKVAGVKPFPALIE